MSASYHTWQILCRGDGQTVTHAPWRSRRQPSSNRPTPRLYECQFPDACCQLHGVMRAWCAPRVACLPASLFVCFYSLDLDGNALPDASAAKDQEQASSLHILHLQSYLIKHRTRNISFGHLNIFFYLNQIFTIFFQIHSSFFFNILILVYVF